MESSRKSGGGRGEEEDMGSDSQSSKHMFSQALMSQRIVNIEHCMAPPVREYDNMYSEFRNSSVKRVPVIRIFGSTSAGQKMCTNVHGVYPYITILDDETVEGFEYRVATAMDAALNDSVQTKFRNGAYNNASTQHVFKVMRVTGRTFYGYKANNEVFLRIFFYNPLLIRKAVLLLQDGSILGRKFQPYESHIPYILQFMIDYSLYGMNFVHYSAVKFRKAPVDPNKFVFQQTPTEDVTISSQDSNISVNFIDPDKIEKSLFGPSTLTKQTRCELEIDVIASDIVLGTKSSEKPISLNPGIDSIWKDEIERRRQHGVDKSSQITIPDSQERFDAILLHKTEGKYRDILFKNIQSFFTKNNGSQEHTQSPISSQLVEGNNFLTSSQLPNHFSAESVSKNITIPEETIESSQQEDEFIKLLEEMAAEVDSDPNEDKILEEEVPFDNDELLDLDPDPNDEAVWDDLNDSIIEKLFDEESGMDEEPELELPNSNSSSVIFQCDGQVDSDNSSCDDHTSTKTPKKRNQPVVAATIRVSNRLSEKKRRVSVSNVSSVSASSSKRVSRKSEISSTDIESPVSRLSLTYRRKSRSQEPKQLTNLPFASTKRKSLSQTSIATAKPNPSSAANNSKLASNSSSVNKSSDKTKLKDDRVEKAKVEPQVSHSSRPVRSGSNLKSQQPTIVPEIKYEGKIGRKLKKLGFDQNKMARVTIVRVDTTVGLTNQPKNSHLQTKQVEMDYAPTDNLASETTDDLSRNNLKQAPKVEHQPDSSNAASLPVTRSKRIAARKQQQQLKDTTESTDNSLSSKVKPVKGDKLANRPSEEPEEEPNIKKSFSSKAVAKKDEQSSTSVVKVEATSPVSTSKKLKTNKIILPDEGEEKETKSISLAVVRNKKRGPSANPKNEKEVVQTSATTTEASEITTLKKKTLGFRRSKNANTFPVNLQQDVKLELDVPMVEVKTEVLENDESCRKPSNEIVIIVPQKELVDASIMCKPTLSSSNTQTEKAIQSEASVQVTAETSSQGLQTTSSSHTIETQTEVEKISVETQTDIVPNLCLCQCKCVVKDKTDQYTGAQEDLKPVMESKKIQVDNVDIIARARTARFTTPQNKTKNLTPSRSPEKRKSMTDTPKRRQITTPTSSRYLCALTLKTPTTGKKAKGTMRDKSLTPVSPRNYPSTPSASQYKFNSPKSTPPSRESKEEYLIHSIKSASASPKKRQVSLKPKQIVLSGGPTEVKPRQSVVLSEDVEIVVVSESSGDDAPEASNVQSSQVTSNDGAEQCDDMSVNSIYEYEEECQKSNATPSPDQSAAPSPAMLISSFQKKRIVSKHRSKTRLEKRRAANLEANRFIPDVFDIEYEPLKQPATYKSTMKWMYETEKSLIDIVARKGELVTEKPASTALTSLKDDSSSEEEPPPPPRLFGGGNLSDGDDDDDDDNTPRSCLSIKIIKPFTPLRKPASASNQTQTPSTNFSQNSHTDTPRSILRSNGNSRRLSTTSLKRKIRWEDEEPTKRCKLDMDSLVENGNETSVLTNETLNKTVDISEIDGPTLKNALGLENSMSNFQDVKAVHQCQFLTTMCVEIHCESRNGLTPDPARDQVLAIFIMVSSDFPENFRKPKEYFKVLFVADAKGGLDFEDYQNPEPYLSEVAMLGALVRFVHTWDPDVLVGYEVEKHSWGYLIQRGYFLGSNLALAQGLSRMLPIVKKDNDKFPASSRDSEQWNGTIRGRIVLNLWRLLRHEIAVQSYTFENAAYHILRRRVYKFSYATLESLWSRGINRHKVSQYYMIRIRGAIQIIEKLDLINRTSELARLFGIQFYEVLSRGSQFRVEGMMLRAIKPFNFIAPSPTHTQRAKMKAPEYLPLILEPKSNYYTDPVAVLDFQSLYPSMMIAYNYDYASLLGRVEHLGCLDRFSLGCLDQFVSPSELLRLKKHIHISPAGVAFLDTSVIKGVVPEMLQQILDTRQMVKRALKRWKNEGTSLQKVLDSRQLGLKLIANVTYGYTSANFSGRMPCVEIADSIVSKGRETLQNAIDHVKSNFHRWGGEVIYGDTDSLFVLFRGKSKDEAFKLGYEIAEEVTQANPKPVKLKFEKIYQPCILQSKKRYVGYSYETPDQVKPSYDAKGIETVRRDGCPAVRKILEKALHVLFTTNNKTKVKDYVSFQFEKLFKGRVSMQDYIFAREFRGREGYKPGACVPSLEIAKKIVIHDPRAEPLTSERVPYVIIYGNPKLQLIKLVRTPEEYLLDSTLRLNAHYYIEKAIIPALNRCLMHAGMDVTKWYLELPRKFLRNFFEQKPKGQGTLDDYILHQNCLKCDNKAEKGLCNNCLADETSTIVYLQEIVLNSRTKISTCAEICKSCSGEERQCASVDCPILHKYTRYERDKPFIKSVERELVNLEW